MLFAAVAGTGRHTRTPSSRSSLYIDRCRNHGQSPLSFIGPRFELRVFNKDLKGTEHLPVEMPQGVLLFFG